MADVHTKEVRSYNMSQIRSKNTRPELAVRKYLFRNGFRYRLHRKDLPGKPDIVIGKFKTIIDVRGCFWHGHKNCKYGDKVKNESSEIAKKVRSAIERDKINEAKWKLLGWNVIVIWDQCDLEIKRKESEKRKQVLVNLKKKLLQIDDTNN